MTLHEFLVDYITDDLYVVKSMYNNFLCILHVCKTCNFLGVIIVFIVVAIAKRTKTVNFLMRYHMDYNSLKNPMFGSLQLCQYLCKYHISHIISIH